MTDDEHLLGKWSITYLPPAGGQYLSPRLSMDSCPAGAARLDAWRQQYFLTFYSVASSRWLRSEHLTYPLLATTQSPAYCARLAEAFRVDNPSDAALHAMYCVRCRRPAPARAKPLKE